jgi:hypothetical protein
MKSAITALETRLAHVTEEASAEAEHAALRSHVAEELRQAIATLKSVGGGDDSSIQKAEAVLARLVGTGSSHEAMVGGLRFEAVLTSAKNGYRIRRACWHLGVWITPADGVKANPAAKFWNTHTRRHAEENGGVADVLPYFVAKMPCGGIQMGWAPDQGDILASDWEVLANPQVIDTTPRETPGPKLAAASGSNGPCASNPEGGRPVRAEMKTFACKHCGKSVNVILRPPQSGKSTAGVEMPPESPAPKATGLTFLEAIEAMKAGKMVCRLGDEVAKSFNGSLFVAKGFFSSDDSPKMVIYSDDFLATDWRIVGE